MIITFSIHYHRHWGNNKRFYRKGAEQGSSFEYISLDALAIVPEFGCDVEYKYDPVDLCLINDYDWYKNLDAGITKKMTTFPEIDKLILSNFEVRKIAQTKLGDAGALIISKSLATHRSLLKLSLCTSH